MPRRRSAPPRQLADDHVARERRAREQRERERRRAAAMAQGCSSDAPQREPRRRRAPVAAPVAVAVRERREGLVGWASRSLAAAPATVVSILRGFALEVVAVLAACVSPLLRLVPGTSRIVEAQRTVLERARGARHEHHDHPDHDGVEYGFGVAIPAPRRVRTAAEQREHERRRALLRRRLRLTLVAMLAVSVLLAWIFVPASDAFRIRHVEVSGARAVGDLEVRTKVDRLLRGKTVYTVDDDAVARRIEELPFVRSARVERHLPGGLELHVVEYRPLALAYGDRRFWLVARDGRILSRASRSEWTGRIPLVTLRGDDLRPGMRVDDEPALRLLAAREAGSTLPLVTVRAEEFHLLGELEGGIEVRFGRDEQLAQKVLVAEEMLQVARRKGWELVYIDVSVPSRPAICERSSSGCLIPRERGTKDADREAGAAGTSKATENDAAGEAAGEATDDAGT